MATYKPLQSVTLTSDTSSVVLSGIDQNYTDLVLTITYGISNAGGSDTRLQVNGSTSSVYSSTLLAGKNTQAPNVASTRRSGVAYFQLHNWVTPINTFTNTCTLQFFDYSNTNKNKSILSKSQTIQGNTYQEVLLQSHLFGSTSAITSLNLYTTSYAFAAGTTFDLYGIKSGAPQALGGDTVITDGNYWYHTFNSTQTFTPLKPLTVDYLVVAGGGGASRLSGGGAGGLRSTVTATGGGGTIESALSISTTQTVTVGAGGAGSVITGGDTSLRGQNGSNSVFGSITSVGGGGGANGNSAGFSGGSGGGGWNPGAGGAGTAGQGFAGGSATTFGGGVPYGQGGGGGAGGAGQAAQSGNIAGVGGVGVQITAFSNPTGTGANSGYYAGGGGASSDSSVTTKAGGAGGGGNGGGLNAGTANTGGGGGAQGGVNGLGGAGGSGIVIVRYPV